MFDAGQYTRFFDQGQEAVRFSVDTWTRLLRTLAGQVPSLAPQFDVEAALDRYFDVTESVLQVQRVVAKQLLIAGTSLASAATAR